MAKTNVYYFGWNDSIAWQDWCKQQKVQKVHDLMKTKLLKLVAFDCCFTRFPESFMLEKWHNSVRTGPCRVQGIVAFTGTETKQNLLRLL